MEQQQQQQRLTRQTKENSSSNFSSSNRILDSATRARRTQKFLDALEQDNFHDDPSEPSSSFDPTLTPEQIAKSLSNTSAFGYSRHSKGLILESDEPTTSNSSNKRRKIQLKNDVFKRRFRKNFPTLLEEELGANGEKSSEKRNYFTIVAKPSKYPPVKLCSVCGLTSLYTCQICGSLYCSLKCLDIHKDTRCLKFTV